VHQNPDGDALGSATALKIILEAQGSTCTIVSPNEPPNYLGYLYNYSQIIDYSKSKEAASKAISQADVCVCIDFSRLERLGEMQQIIKTDKHKWAVIDHHPGPENFAEAIISEPVASSTAELLYYVIKTIGLENNISPAAADALLTGLITDTGCFRHNCSRPETYMAAAGLVAIGASHQRIIDAIFNSQSLAKMKLVGMSINKNLKIYDEGASLIYITKNDMAELGISSGETEGIVNMALSVEGIVFSALLTESEGGFTKVSLRSMGAFPANSFSEKYFAGGGHFNAAGGRIKASIEETIAIFELGLKEYSQILAQEVNKTKRS
jgi:bifunctional oligoribonuclease and PAP phosphatase NrnA